MPARSSGSAAATASKMRSEPDAWSARVITARPPAFSTQAAMASESVATTTSPSCAACARRMTCTIIGTPAMSASGLPGNRVEAMRAGIRMRISAIGAFSGKVGTGFPQKMRPRKGWDRHLKCVVVCRVIRVARGEANRLFVRRRIRALVYPSSEIQRRPEVGYIRLRRRGPPDQLPDLEAMDSFELNKILGAILGTCLGVLTINIAAGAIFAPVKPAKPGYDIVVPEAKPGGEAKPAEPEVPI